MDSAQLAALAAAAVLVFWMVGAYNRLMAMRNGIGWAFARLDEAFGKRGEAIAPLINVLHHTLASEQVAFDTLRSTLAQHHQAADALRARPASVAEVRALSIAEAQLVSASGRVRALAETATANDRLDVVMLQLSAWHDADARIVFARQLFNDAVHTYNTAAQQFPTRLLLRWFGLSLAEAL